MASYIIIKYIKQPRFDVEIPVIILDGLGEVLELDNLNEAQELLELFQKNSDSGHRYEIKKTGSHG
jgi:hypothetical protein